MRQQTSRVVTVKLAKRRHDSSVSREGHVRRSRIRQKNSAFIVSTLTQPERLILLQSDCRSCVRIEHECRRVSWRCATRVGSRIDDRVLHAHSIASDKPCHCDTPRGERGCKIHRLRFWPQIAEACWFRARLVTSCSPATCTFWCVEVRGGRARRLRALRFGSLRSVRSQLWFTISLWRRPLSSGVGSPGDATCRCNTRSDGCRCDVTSKQTFQRVRCAWRTCQRFLRS